VGQFRSDEAPVPISSPDLFDQAALDNIRSIDVQSGGSLLAKVFSNFKKDAFEKVEELRACSGDAAVLAAGAHAIKSMSLNLGAKALSDYCRQCESLWRQGDISDAPRRIELMAGHLHDAVNALQRLIEAEEVED
jgi:HPt (histidine-containing phosphotransfer) domain-containing protein